ncbi:MAG: nickel-dependent hydrogenase large subunit [Synergistaceae bacterium]|nr:nickel-dependent hydrogenase large subunit [Synergistaceae bacterium]
MSTTYTIPVGPVHVGLKEPITAWLELEGERIVNARVRPGAIHRGIEFMARERNPIQVIYLSERICGICSFSHVICFIRAVEDLAQMNVPVRGQYIRSLVLELERVHSHLLWSGVACYTIGFDSAFHLGMQMRERVMDVLELLSGNRVNYGVATFGGVRWDVTPELEKALRGMVRYYRQEFTPFREIVMEDPVAQARMRNVGVLTRDEAVRYSAVGPTARASGLRIDLRKSSPYEAYADFDVEPVVPQDYFGEAHGDVLDRFAVRVLEVYQSLDIIEKILDGLPEGPFVEEANLNKVMASLKKADGTGWGIIEAPRGDDTHIVSLKGGVDNVLWWKVRAPTYANAVSWPIMFRGNELADAPLIINSIDPCISCMERMLVTDEREYRSEVVTRSELVKRSRQKTFELGSLKSKYVPGGGAEQ